MSTPAGGDLFRLPERWILSRLQKVCAEVDDALEAFRFADAANAIYQFVWYELCDWYIEMAKPSLHIAGGDPDPHAEARRHVAQGVLATVLETTLRLLHPFAPFVTEEIWQKLPKPSSLPSSLMVTLYPRKDERLIDLDLERRMALVQEVTVATRMLRATYNVPPSWSVPIEVRASDDDKRAILERHRDIVENGAKVTVTLLASGHHVAQSAKAVIGADVEVVMALAGLVDIESEKARIGKEIGKADKDIAGLEMKLENQYFLARAPEDVVAEQRARLSDEQARRTRLVDALAALG
jgi:valyl-tRNA synthetase